MCVPGGVYGFVRCVAGNDWQEGGTPTGMLSCFKYIFVHLIPWAPFQRVRIPQNPASGSMIFFGSK